MTMQSLPGGFVLIPSIFSTIGNGTVVLDANGEKSAFITQAPKSGEISKIHFHVGSVSTTGNLDVRLETVDATTGDPTGTLKDTNSNISIEVLDSDDNTWRPAELTADATVTKGDIIAIVVVADATFNGQIRTSFSYMIGGFGYQDSYITGAWVKTTSRAGVIALEYDDGSYAFSPGLNPLDGGNIAFNNTSTPDHIGMIFQVPFPVRVTGLSLYVDLDGDADVKLYDSDGTTVLETVSLDKDIRGSAGGTVKNILFASTHLLTKDTNYRLVVEPTSATSIRLYYGDAPSAAALNAISGGSAFHYTTKKDAGWTETTTRRLWMALIVDQFDDGVGGGGGGRPELRGSNL